MEHTLGTSRRSTPLGFALYGSLTPADRQLSQEIDALAEPLSTVAAKVSRS